MDEREHGTSYQSGGSSYGGDAYGGYGPFGGFDPFGGAYGNGGSARNDYGNSEQEMRLQAAANYINSGHFREAMNVLNDISDRSGNGISCMRSQIRASATTSMPCRMPRWQSN